LGNPILSASLPGDHVEDYTDPEIIHDRFEKLVDVVIDAGIGGMMPSTIVDYSKGEAEVTRQGAGEWEG
jgi:tRNA A37 threonylcarbamoyladenosine synthetase subunit TsaC/SUA5/YrdC